MSTADYLNQLITDRNNLADNLTALGASSTHNETFTQLAPKVLSIKNILQNLNIIKNTSGQSLNLAKVSDTTKGRLNVDGFSRQNTVLLPEEYQQVEYIESTGTQYIDTGIVPDNNTKTEIKFFNNSVGSWYIFGARTSSSSTIFYAQSGSNMGATIFPRINGQGNDVGWVRNTTGAIYEVKLETKTNVYDYKIKDITNNREYSVNDVNYEPFNNAPNIYMFGLNVNNIQAGKTRLYYFKIFQNNVLVRNFIPCYRKSDNEVGLYDLVNSVFYTNQGTGSFTYGELTPSSPSTPSPDYPSEIRNLEGKNLIKFDNFNGNFSSNQLTSFGNIIELRSAYSINEKIECNNNYFYLECTNNYDNLTYYKLKNLKPNTQYTISGTVKILDFISVTSIRIFGIGHYTSEFINNKLKYTNTIITDENGEYVGDTAGKAFVYLTGSHQGFKMEIEDIQLEEGTVATDYVPYNTLRFKKLGKNLAKEVFDQKLYINGSGQNRTVISSNNNQSQIIKVKSSTNYIASGDFSPFSEEVIRICMFDEMPIIGSVSTKMVYGSSGINFTTDTNTKYILVYNTYARNTTIPNLMIKENSIGDDTYEPYHAPKTIDFPLSTGQKLYEGSKLTPQGIYNEITEYALTGTESWYLANIDELRYPFRILREDAKITESKTERIISNQFIVSDSSEFDGAYKDQATFRKTNYNRNFWFFMPKNQIAGTTSEEILTNWKTVLVDKYNSGNPVKMQYPLETPTVTPYTEAQAKAYNELSNLEMYNGTNIIELDSNEYTVIHAEYGENAIEVIKDGITA